MRSAVALLLVLSGCNLFGATPEIPDVDAPSADGGADVAEPADASSVGDMRDAATADLASDMTPDSAADMTEGCTTNRSCSISLACIDGACVPRLAAGEACLESDDCETGLCGVGGVCVVLATPLARYRIDEAAAGTAPAVLRDDATDPLNLSLSYENPSGFRVDPAGNRYARFIGNQTGAAAAITGTKIEEAFDGGTTGTLEVKSMTFRCDNSQFRVLGMGTGGVPTEDGWFTFREYMRSDAIYVKFLPNASSTELHPSANDCLAQTPVVTHVVVDTTELGESDRIKMYVDGRPISLVGAVGNILPTLNQGLDLGLPVEDRYMFVGRPNPVAGSRGTNQRVWYAAVYSEALSEAVVQRNAAKILLDDDAPGAVGVITRTVGVNGDFATLQSWYDARRGDLRRRAVIATAETGGLFEAGERVTSPDGCGGTAVAENRTGTRATFVALDDYTAGCVEGSMLVGEDSGATAKFAGVLLRGTIERAALEDTDAAGAVLDGSTTDADHYFVVTSASNMAHRGVLGAGATIQPSGDGLRITQPFTRVERLRIANTPAGSTALHIEAPGVVIRHALVQASAGDAIVVGADDVVIEDSIVFNSTQAGVHHMSGAGVILRNLTLVGIGGIAIRSAGDATVHNVIANGATGFAADAAWASASHNISTDGSAPGSNSQLNVSIESLFVSLVPGMEDLHLAPDSPAVNAGIDTGNVSWDIDLETRTGAWDIGADEL